MARRPLLRLHTLPSMSERDSFAELLLHIADSDCTERRVPHYGSKGSSDLRTPRIASTRPFMPTKCCFSVLPLSRLPSTAFKAYASCAFLKHLLVAERLIETFSVNPEQWTTSVPADPRWSEQVPTFVCDSIYDDATKTITPIPDQCVSL